MRVAALLLVILLAASPVCSASAQQAGDDDLKIPPAPVPKLPSTGHRTSDFAPPGWKVDKEATGDLNGDGLPDLAFAVQETSKSLVLHPKYGMDPLDTNPRVIGIALANRDGTYTLVAQNSTLVPRWVDASFEDVFGDEGGIDIKHGVLSVALHNFARSSTEDTTFTFRMQHGRLELIGYEWWAIQRISQDVEKTSVNYSTGIGFFSKEPNQGRAKTVRKQLPPKPLLTFEQVSDGIDFKTPFTEME